MPALPLSAPTAAPPLALAAPALAAAVGLALLALALLAWALQRRRARPAALGAGLGAGAVLLVLQPVPAALAWGLLVLVAAAVWLLAGRHARLRARAEALHLALQTQQQQARQAAEAWQGQQRQAEAADEAKTRFLAAASHELRQPVHALALQLEALHRAPLAPEPQAIAHHMAAAVAALQAMAGTLLDVSRLNAGAVLPRWDVLPLAPLLRRLADDTAPQAEARGLRLALRLHDDGAATVTDAHLLERVLRNLLDNAVKYTQQGGVLLALRQRRARAGEEGGAGGASLRLEVWDTGPGIAAADHERIFQDYQQLPARAEAGLGLGLALVRDLVQQLQLRLVLHSRPGRGTVFFIEGLPLAAPGPRRVAAARHAQQPAGPCA